MGISIGTNLLDFAHKRSGHIPRLCIFDLLLLKKGNLGNKSLFNFLSNSHVPRIIQLNHPKVYRAPHPLVTSKLLRSTLNP